MSKPLFSHKKSLCPAAETFIYNAERRRGPKLMIRSAIKQITAPMMQLRFGLSFSMSQLMRIEKTRLQPFISGNAMTGGSSPEIVTVM